MTSGNQCLRRNWVDKVALAAQAAQVAPAGCQPAVQVEPGSRADRALVRAQPGPVAAGRADLAVCSQGLGVVRAVGRAAPSQPGRAAGGADTDPRVLTGYLLSAYLVIELADWIFRYCQSLN